MKTGIYVICIAAFTLIAAVVNGQMFGLPLGRDAKSAQAGDAALSGGVLLGEDINLYSARLVYQVLDNTFIFGDIGAVDPDNGSSGWGVQGGFQYSLPFLKNSGINVALRTSIGYATYGEKYTDRNSMRWRQHSGEYALIDSDYEVLTVTGGGVMSRQFEEFISIYGFIGAAYIHKDVDQEVDVKSEGIWLMGGAPMTVERYRDSSTDSEIEPAFGVGALLSLTEKYSVHAELMHIKNRWFIVGLNRHF